MAAVSYAVTNQGETMTRKEEATEKAAKALAAHYNSMMPGATVQMESARADAEVAIAAYEAHVRPAKEAEVDLSEAKLVSTYYRSLTPDGKMWCESRDPDEVREMSEGMDCTFEVIHFYEVTDGWQEWK